MTVDDNNPFYLTQPKRRSGSGALILDTTGKVLMVEPTYKPTWEIPGGIVENGEDPRTACRRECVEEIGLEIDLGRLLVLEHPIEEPPRGDSIMFIYDGGVIENPESIQVQREELHRFRFVATEDLETITTIRLARRIRQAISARNDGCLIEMVDGIPAKTLPLRQIYRIEGEIMPSELWNDVDRYFVDRLLPFDPILDGTLKRSADGGLPDIQVTANQGKLLHQFVKMTDAKRILEIGTLGGFSTIWLARALPSGGEVITLELEPRHADVARANFEAAGLVDRIEIKVGRAVDSLAEMYASDPTPFDFIFIDADKPSNPDYWEWSLKFARPGTVIIIDNVVRDGGVIDPDSENPQIIGVRQVTEMIAHEPRVEATALQTVGSKGYDGFILARVVD